MNFNQKLYVVLAAALHINELIRKLIVELDKADQQMDHIANGDHEDNDDNDDDNSLLLLAASLYIC